MIFSLDVRPAKKGDCLLLHYGTAAKPRLMLIDGGPKAVYGPHLKPRLEEVRQARALAAHQPLNIDLLMVSHVDDDHIHGILDLTSELRNAVGTPFVRVRRAWHNSFDAIIGNDPKELTAGVAAQFGPAALAGELPDDATLEDGGEDLEVARSTLKVLASIPQGFQLRGDFDALGIETNPDTDGKLVMAAKKKLSMPGGVSLTVAGPLKPEIVALQKKHDAWLAELKKKGKKPEDVLAAYVDRSVPNLSSIVVVAQAGGKSMLLTGDARGDKILAGLETIGQMAKGGKMHVDVLKVPHHGSAHNLTTAFFERVTADHYVFSGNGEHGNPEREAVEMLLDARGAKPFTIHLTYPIAEIDAARKADWKKEQAKEKKRKQSGTSKKQPRPNWSAPTHSLAALFEQRPLAARQQLRIAAEPHVIDLLAPLGF